jgi:hypothetical protein
MYDDQDSQFDLTCKCGLEHDDCAADCQCTCHDEPNPYERWSTVPGGWDGYTDDMQ